MKKLNDAFNTALATPEMREKIAGPGNVVGCGSSEEFSAFIATEGKRWGQLIKAKGIRLE